MRKYLFAVSITAIAITLVCVSARANAADPLRTLVHRTEIDGDNDRAQVPVVNVGLRHVLRRIFHGHGRGYSYGHRHRGYYGRSVYLSIGSPLYYGYRPRSYFYGYPYRSYYPSYGYGCISPYAYVPPAATYAPAGIAYGPDAVKEFMGVDRDFGKGMLVAPRADGILPAEGGRLATRPKIVDVEKNVRISSVTEKERADKFISYGDAQFGEQKYHQAAQRYKSAAETAPDVADAHFRQGHAYVASNRYDLAAQAIRRGLQLDPLWVNSSFRVDELYGKNQLAKTSHVDGLARAALADRGNADYLFLLGVFLHFDGQQERAQKFFRRAADLTDGETSHLDAFLKPPAAPADKAI